MSYRVEFDGSLVNNRDLVQVTTASSLTKTNIVQLNPSLWEFNGSGSVPILQTGSTGGVPNPNNATLTGIYKVQPSYNPIANQSGGFLNVNETYNDTSGFGLYDVGIHFYVNLGSDLSGTFTTDVKYTPPSGANFHIVDIVGYRTNASAGFSAGAFGIDPTIPYTSTYIGSGSSVRYIRVSITWSGSSPLNVNYTYDYIRINLGEATPISIAPSTFQEGFNKTGGSLVNALGETIQSGQTNLAEPSEKFGLVVKDGASTKASAQYLSPALNSEDSLADVKDAKIITADNTSLTIESTGTGGAESIEAGSSVIVEDYSIKTES